MKAKRCPSCKAKISVVVRRETLDAISSYPLIEGGSSPLGAPTRSMVRVTEASGYCCGNCMALIGVHLPDIETKLDNFDDA